MTHQSDEIFEITIQGTNDPRYPLLLRSTPALSTHLFLDLVHDIEKRLINISMNSSNFY